MNHDNPPKLVTRRGLIKAGAAGLVATAAGQQSVSAKEAPKLGEPACNPNVTPLAQDHVIVAQTPDVNSHYIHDPGMTRLDNGHLFVATPARTRRRKQYKDFSFCSLSVDGGKTWETVSKVSFADATPIVHLGELYLMGQYRQGGDWLIMKSTDEGRSWTEPVCLFKGSYWNCQTSMVERDGLLYWAMGAQLDKHRWYAHVAVACDLKRGLLNPDAWRVSNVVEPPFPDLCSSKPKMEGWKGNMQIGLGSLEPNVVQVGDRLMAIFRVTIMDYSTSNMGIVFDIRDEDGQLRLDFTQYHPIPGGQCKFFILHDEVTDLFFMLTNLATDSHDAFKQRPKHFTRGAGNERRLLYLFYGRDALNWFPAGCVAKMPGMLQSFMYPSAVIDGEDIAFISRTSKNGRDQHDADLCTFHRIRNFRSLAMDLRPEQ